MFITNIFLLDCYFFEYIVMFTINTLDIDIQLVILLRPIIENYH